jgi:hypothetical protein
MNSQTHTIRQWISVGLCVFGLVLPPAFFLLSMMLRYRLEASIYSYMLKLYLHRWLPITVFFWLAASFVYPDGRWRMMLWIASGIGLILSAVSYFFYLANH